MMKASPIDGNNTAVLDKIFLVFDKGIMNLQDSYANIRNSSVVELRYVVIRTSLSAGTVELP